MPEIEIIDKPRLKSFLRNITELSFTAIMWGLWMYLFLPILNIILWLLGIGYFYKEFFESTDYLELLNLFGKLGWSILAVFLILRLWGCYNYRRFGKMDRRKSLLSNLDKALAEHFRIPVEQIPYLQSHKEVVWPIQHGPKLDVANWMVRDKSNSQKESQ